MSTPRLAAVLWVAMAIASTLLFRVESERHRGVIAAVEESGIGQRNPVVDDAVHFARDPDHAAASFARAVVVDSLVRTAPADDAVSRLVLQRSFAAYLPPDRFPAGDFASELLANQELLARASDETDASFDPRLQAARERARELAIRGISVRPAFAEHHFTLQMLETSGVRGDGAKLNKESVILSEAKDPLVACDRASPEGILRFAQDDMRFTPLKSRPLG